MVPSVMNFLMSHGSKFHDRGRSLDSTQQKQLHINKLILMQKVDDKWQASIAQICSFSFTPSGMVKKHTSKDSPSGKKK